MKNLIRMVSALAIIGALALAPAGAANAKPAPTDAGANSVASPNWSQISFWARNGGYMNVFGYHQGNGGQVGLWYTNGPTKNEIFYLEDAGSHVYRLRLLYEPSTCLDVPGSNFKPGVYLQTYTCNGTDAQTFKFFEHSGHTVLAADWNGNTPKICLDVHTNHQGERVWLWSCNGSGQQDWN